MKASLIKLDDIQVNEVFVSLQGEGGTVGQRRLFIRFPNCNLKCKWCDTKYASEKRHRLNNTDKTLLKNIKHWVFTGGEPLLYTKEMDYLIDRYKPTWIEVETNGTIDLDWNHPLFYRVNLWNISPKSKLSQENSKINVEPILLRKYTATKDFIVKFVVESKNTISFIKKIIKKYKLPDATIYLMPQGATKEEYESNLKNVWFLCVKYNYNLSPRMHIEVFDKQRGI